MDSVSSQLKITFNFKLTSELPIWAVTVEYVGEERIENKSDMSLSQA